VGADVDQLPGGAKHTAPEMAKGVAGLAAGTVPTD
jgi:hypothetical protein